MQGDLEAEAVALEDRRWEQAHSTGPARGSSSAGEPGAGRDVSNREVN